MSEQEVWKPIPGFESYEINTQVADMKFSIDGMLYLAGSAYIVLLILYCTQ